MEFFGVLMIVIVALIVAILIFAKSREKHDKKAAIKRQLRDELEYKALEREAARELVAEYEKKGRL